MQPTSQARVTAKSMLLATILAAGLFTIWIFALIAGSMVYPMFVTHDWRQLVFTVEGEPLWESRIANSPQAGYRTLDGRTIDDPRSVHLSPQLSYNSLPSIESPIDYRTGWEVRLRGFLQADPPASFRYLIHDGHAQGQAYLAGYDPVTRQLIGYLGKAGFQSDIPQPADRFGISLALLFGGGFAPHGASLGTEPYLTDDELGPIQYLVADGELWALDLKRQSVERLPLPDKVLSVSTYDELTAVDDERHFTSKKRLVVRYADQLGLFDLQFKPLQTIPLPAEIRRAALEVIRTTTNQLLVIATPRDYSSHRELYWFDPAGSVARQLKTPPIYPPSDDSDMASSFAVCGAAPLPGLLAGLSFAMANQRPGAEPESFWQRYAKVWSYFWLPYVVVSLVSLGLAVYCYRRQRAVAPGSALAWSVFVFLTGLPGLIGYLVHRNWPSRIANQAAPVPLGIEVFA